MQKFLITFTSSNPITGPIMVTTSPRSTCPTTCSLRRTSPHRPTLCYAEHGHLGGFIWTGLDKTPAGSTFASGIRVYDLSQLSTAIRCLVPGSVWRHNQAGDLFADPGGTIDAAVLWKIVAANRERRGFTFTHHDVLDNRANRQIIRTANAHGFRINISANDLDHADALASLGIAPVAAIVPSTQRSNITTARGRKVVICPARTRRGVTCSTCQLCTRVRDVIVGLPTLTSRDNNIYGGPRNVHTATPPTRPSTIA